MAVLTSITVDWRQSPRLITVAAPVTSVSVQDLYDTLRDLEDEPVNLGYNHIISAGGKEPLDVALGTAVGITATLLNAVIEFEARGTPTVCKVSGGNLVAQDADALPIDPIVFTTNVLAIIAQSSSATINDVSLTQRLQHLIASQDETHSPMGNFFYWDPVNGDDTNDAQLPESARKTFASIHDDLCSGITRDTVIALSRTAGTGSTIVTERIVITKNHVLLHGPGRGLCFQPVGDTADTITVTGAFGVEIDSMRIQTGAGPTERNAIAVGGGSNHVKLSNLYMDVEAGEFLTGRAVQIMGGSHHIIDNLYIQGAGDDGIHLEDTINTTVDRCKIFQSGNSGIHLMATTPGDVDHVTLNNNVVQHSVDYDLRIQTNVTNTAVRWLNDITNANSILDNGTNTQWERLNQSKESAFWNWEEAKLLHVTPGTYGYDLIVGTPTIKQAWTRAVTGGSKMRAVVGLEINGQMVVLPGTATLDVVVRDSAGTALISQTGISPNASGYFAMTEDPFTPSAGVNLASFATITNGSDVYVGLTPISFPEFS